jgi:hypothetical protein
MLTAEGVKALLEVKEQKLAHPESLVMHSYLQETESGICTCIGGQLILNKYGLDKLRETSEVPCNCHVLASSILGMPVTKEEIYEDRTLDTDKLFYVSCWSESLINSWDEEEEYSPERALVVAEVIDKFVATHYKTEKETENA